MDELELLALATAAARNKQSAPQRNPDGTYGQPPEGMFLNPNTGQMTSRDMLANNMEPMSQGQSAARGVYQGGTFQFGDEIQGGINAALGSGGNMADRYKFGTEYARAADEVARENGAAYTTGEIGGAVAAPGATFGTLARGASTAKKIATGAVVGGATGAAYGAGQGETLEERVSGATQGAGVGAVAGTAAVPAGALVQRVADGVAKKKAIRTALDGARKTADMRRASGSQYDAFEAAGAEISPAAMNRLRDGLTARLTGEGLDTLPGQSGTPGGQRIVDKVGLMADEVGEAAAAGQNPAVPLTSIEQLRRQAGNTAQEINPIGRATPDARLGSIAVDEIDSFVNSLQAADVPIGDPKVATEALTKARKLWAQASKTQLLDNVLESQDDYLGGPASAIRNKVGSLLRNPKTRRQFSEGELEVLRKIIGGNGLTRAVRLAGNGIGRQLQAIGGATLGGIPGALAGVVTGEVSGELANRSAIRSAQAARDIIANGGLNTLPVASESKRRMIEALLRRGGATSSQ